MQMTTTASTKTIEQEMLALENQYWQAMKDGDVEAAQRLTADPCVVAGASGVAAIDGELFGQMMQGGDWKLKSFKLDDVLVQPLTSDTRIVAYKVHEDLTVAGQPVGMDAADTSVWVRKDGAWVCAMHTESLLGDAYGHDRKATT
jgi:hypothetical protein